MHDKGIMTDEIIYNCLFIIFGVVTPYLFLELAFLMNTAMWIYYFLVIKTIRKVRKYEIDLEESAER